MKNQYNMQWMLIPFITVVVLLVLLFALSYHPVSASPDTVYSSGPIGSPTGDVPDSGCSGSNYLTHTINIPDTGLVGDVNVTLSIDHTFDDDLDMFLLGPDGTTEVELATDIGGSGDNFTNTVFDDEAATAIFSVDTSSEAPFTGSYQPEGSLSSFDGMDISGDWTLRICDDAGGDLGTLQAWSLEIELAAIFNIDTSQVSNILVAEGGTATKPITISNTGGSLLTWTLDEAAPLAGGGRAINVFTEDFESGLGAWSNQAGNLNSSTNVFTANTSRSNSPTTSARLLYDTSNNIDAWFVSPAIAISASGGDFSFYESIDYANDIDTHEVMISTDYAGDVATATWTTVSLAAAIEDTWQMQGPYDLAAYANQSIYIAFHYIGTNADAWYLDDIQITEPEACDSPSDVSWLSLSTTIGTTAAGASSTIDVTVDATAYTEGDIQNAHLCVDHDGVVAPLARLVLDVNIAMDVQSPTAIELSSFTATAQADGSVAVEWVTAAEWDHAGFNVYRSDTEDGVLTQVNGAIIASTGMQGQGASYSLIDQDATVGTQWYTLEDVDLDGVRTLHGPISVEARTPTAVSLAGAGTSAFSGIGSILLLTATMLLISLAIFTKLTYARRIESK